MDKNFQIQRDHIIMKSKIPDFSVIVIPYQWILENIEKEPKILSSKMILFRGEEIFRVALKNAAEKQTLIFMALNLHKLGMKVHNVLYSNHKLEKSMESLIEQYVGGTLQVFSASLCESVFEKTTFNFQIQIEASVTHFSYQLADRLLKNQLWMAVKQLQWTDIDLIVEGKKISAHKCVLAARSQVFAAEFDKDEKIKQILFENVDVSTVEHFLHFLYTGESNRSFANEQLLEIANRYELATLVSLCKNALEQINVETLIRSVVSLYPDNISIHLDNNPTLPFETRPTKDTELYFDPNTSTFIAEIYFNYQNNTNFGPDSFEYQNEKLFSVYIKKSTYGQEICLFCTKHSYSGYELTEVLFNAKHAQDHKNSKWIKMERKIVQEQGFILIFSSRIPVYYICNYIRFRIKIASSIENYRYELMDATSATQLWSAATNRQLTDVEIFVGSRKFEVHRVVLSARSPVFNVQLNKGTNLVKSSITIGETVDPEIFQHFLEFIYTGTLKIAACSKQILALAEMYEVETLKKLCQVNRELDAERVTTSILAVF